MDKLKDQKKTHSGIAWREHSITLVRPSPGRQHSYCTKHGHVRIHLSGRTRINASLNIKSDIQYKDKRFFVVQSFSEH